MIRYLPMTLLFPAAVATLAAAQTVVDFEEFDLAPQSHYAGADLAGGFTSQGVEFSNEFTVEFGSWSGFAYSNVTDNTTAGWGNQYSAFPGSGAQASENYGIAFVSTFSSPGVITLPESASVESIAISNTTYAGLSMRDGDSFAKKFGGADGDDPDFLRLDVLGIDAEGNQIDKVEVYLADFRSDDFRDDFILDTWKRIDLSPLGGAATLQFAMETTDVGEFGANTPFYFAFDDLTFAVPEPGGLHIVLLLGLLGMGCLRRRSR